MASRLSWDEVKVRGQAVRFHAGGAGQPVVLVHGLAGSLRWWHRNVPALMERYRLYLLDLPGYGGMRRAGRGLRLSDVAGWLAEWMSAVGLERTHVIGHSMGGYIGARLAARWPERVDRLVLVAPAGVRSPGSAHRYLLPLLRATRSLPPRLYPIMVKDALRAEPRTLWRAARELLAVDVLDDLDSIQAPTLLVWGERDSLVPPSLGRIFEQEIPAARLLILDGAGHVPMFHQPERFNRSVAEFLSAPESDEPYAGGVASEHRMPGAR